MSSTLDDTTAQEGFAARLRELTTQDHRDAEGSELMRELVEGTLAVERFGDLLAQHLFLYRALEGVADRLAGHPVVAPFLFDGLARTAVLEADVRALLGDAARPAPLPATAAYVERIEAMETWPGGFVAHHYTRYLGDLSGGQHIRRVVERAYPDLPVGFYRFEAVETPKALKDAYRARLDGAPWDDDEQARIVDEVRRAYALNTAMFSELDGA